MEQFRRITSAVVAVFMVSTLFAVSPVSAEAPEAAQESIFDFIKNDAASQEYLLYLNELTEKARAGDINALRELDHLGDDLRDIFPDGGFVEGDWKNGVQSNAMDWNIRKFDSVNVPQPNYEARQSAAGSGLVPYRSPAPSFSRNMLVTRDVGTPIQNEPHMAVNPVDSQNIVVASHNYGMNAPPVQVSFDGGETWRGPIRVPLTEQSVFGGDPVLTFAPDGTLYYGFMSLGVEVRTLLGMPLSITKSDIAVAASYDGGLTWEQPAEVARNKFKFEKYPITVTNPKTGEEVTIELNLLAISFLDKSWITSGPDPKDPNKKVLYASWTNFTQYLAIIQPLQGFIAALPVQWTTEIEVYRSTNDGKSWEKVPVMSPVPAIKDVGKVLTNTTSTDTLLSRHVQGSQLAVANDGTVYAAWYDSTDDGASLGRGQQWVTKSSDRGDTWDEPVLANDYLEVQRQSRSVPFRTTNNPSLAVGPNNEVYLVHAGRTAQKLTDDGDIYFVAGIENSSGKLEFTKPVMVNKDKTDNIQFFPAVDAGPDGTAHVMWGDTRDDPAGLKYHIYYSKSDDLGKTWGFDVRGVKENDTRVTDFPSNPNMGFPRGRFIGDYFAIEATEDDIYMVWTDSRLGEYAPYSQKIGFARRSAIPSPEVVMNPSRGSSGKEVTVQAFNFQPDVSVFVQVGGDISACGVRTDENGFTQCKVLMPVMASEGVQDIVVYDESGNFASASFFTEVGFDNLALKDGTNVLLPGDGPSSSENRVPLVVVIVMSIGALALLAAMRFALLRQVIDRIRKRS